MRPIKLDGSNLKTFVINLDDYRENYNKQFPYLEKIGLKPVRYNGINALKNEHLKEENNIYISNFAKNFTPKSIIGCALSHILCCKYIHDNYICNKDNTDNDNNFYLIMEDDAYPLYSKEEFNKKLNITIYEIELLDKNWEIIQLHSDAFFPTQNTYNTHFMTGSTAAYLISKRGIAKMLTQKVRSHLDFETQNFIKYNKYRVKNNLFYTNEKNSLNRSISNKYNYYSLSVNMKTRLIENINNYIISIPLRGEKTYKNFLEFKLLKLPYFIREYTANELIDSVVGLYILKKLIY